MQRNARNLLRHLRTSPIEKVTEHVTRAHRHLEGHQLTNLQQAFIRLPYTLESNALILFDEISLTLQNFVRELLQHYILEGDVYGECINAPDTPHVDKAISERLHQQHQSLQESLSDLQTLASHLSNAAPTTDVLRFSNILNELAENLHEQILTEDKILLPRCGRN